MCCRPQAAAAGGFSLVEVMIVIVIIGLMAGVVTVNVQSYMDKAKQNTARQEIATLVKALDTFYASYGRYPTSEEGLECLAKPTEKIPEALIKGVPNDPWGRPYQYVVPGVSGPYDLISFGADGREGGEGKDADITSESIQSKK